jgi:hypothetical protein
MAFSYRGPAVCSHKGVELYGQEFLAWYSCLGHSCYSSDCFLCFKKYEDNKTTFKAGRGGSLYDTTAPN